MTPDKEPIVISKEATEFAVGYEALLIGKIMSMDQRMNMLAVEAERFRNSSTAPLKAEIERLRDLDKTTVEAYLEKQQELSNQLHSLSQQNEQLKSEIEDNERWQKEVLSDFKIQYDDHKQGIRLAFTQWMSDKLGQNEQLEKQVLELKSFLHDTLVSLEGDVDGTPDASGRAKLANQITNDIEQALSSTPADIAKKWVSRGVLEQCSSTLENIINGCVHPDKAVRAVMVVDLIPIKEALTIAQKELEK